MSDRIKQRSFHKFQGKNARKYTHFIKRLPKKPDIPGKIFHSPIKDFPILLSAVSLLLIGFLLYSLYSTLSPLLIGVITLVFFWLARKSPFTPVGVLNAFVIFLLFVWLLTELSDLLIPFIIAFVLAFLFDPLVVYLSRKIPRTYAIFIIILVIIALLLAFAAVLIPMISEQVNDLFKEESLDGFKALLSKSLKWLNEKISKISIPGISLEKYTADIPIKVQEYIDENISGIGPAFKKIFTKSLGIIYLLVNLIVIPFVTYYLLRDYTKIKDSASKAIPERHRLEFHHIYNEINNIVGGWLRGQLIVCIFIMAITSTGLLISGIKYWLVLGIMAGILAFLPYIGVVLGFIPAAIIALANQGWAGVLKVFVVFFIVQTIEGNIVSPNIVGKKVGLNPVWVILSLLVFAHFWGFAGVLLAIPLAAIISVAVKQVFISYTSSQYYLKHENSTR